MSESIISRLRDPTIIVAMPTSLPPLLTCECELGSSRDDPGSDAGLAAESFGVLLVVESFGVPLVVESFGVL